MALDRKEKRLLGTVVGIVVAIAVWNYVSAFVMPRMKYDQQIKEAQSRQVIVGEGDEFSLTSVAYSDQTDDSYGFNPFGGFWDGTLTFRVDGSRLYKTKSEMEEAEGFECSEGNDVVSTSISEEPLGLVVDVSITNENATAVNRDDGQPTYFSMDFFGLQIADTSNMTSYFCGQDLHVPEFYDSKDSEHYWSTVDIPQGETVHVRLAFVMPPASSEEELGKMAQVLMPVYHDGDQLILYYGPISYAGFAGSFSGMDQQLQPVNFAVASARIPYLVELSPEVM